MEATCSHAWPPAFQELCRHANVDYRELFEIITSQHFKLLLAVGSEAKSWLENPDPEKLRGEHTEFVSGVLEDFEARDGPMSEDERTAVSNLCAFVLQASANPLAWQDLTEQEAGILDPAAVQDLVNRNSHMPPQDPYVPAEGNPLPTDVNFVVWWTRGKGELPTWCA